MALFTAIKVPGPFGDIYRTTIGWSQWALSAAPRLIAGRPLGCPHRAELMVDTSDLLALPMALVAVWVGSSVRRETLDSTRSITGD